MNEKELDILVDKFMNHRLTTEEHQIFFEWLNSLPEDKAGEILGKCSSAFERQKDVYLPKYNSLIEAIEQELDHVSPKAAISKPETGHVFLYIAAALITGILCVFFYSGRQQNPPAIAVHPSIVKPIVPGSNKAVLTLADGKRITLAEAESGLLAQQHDLQIYKTDHGELICSKKNNSSHAGAISAGVNTLSTPRGGQYKLTLADGTMVWLNAATTLKFPAVFTGHQRLVELNGEAYFEVAKNMAMPFIVRVNQSSIEVLGTHFNVMGYSNEPAMHTTLLEGAVRISRGKELRNLLPGQEAVVQQGIIIKPADTSQAVGWKNGNFSFSHERIDVVMNKIARWYDVDIQYQGKVTREEFVGVVPRSKELADVLRKLELTGLLKFKIKERSVIVMN